MSTVVLAYSGGLDTSVSIHWIKEKYGLDVITLTIDVGNERDVAAIARRAEQIGAIKALIVDGRADFVRYFVWPALQAGAIYEGQYPLATALARPLIARLLVEVARSEGAGTVGCSRPDQTRRMRSTNEAADTCRPARRCTSSRINRLRAATRGSR